MQHLDNKRALVVFSGGQDSTTCLFWAKAHFEEVWALSFTYGQKHVHEVDLARQIAKDANVHFDCMDASFISQLATSCSLTDTSIVMDSEKPAAGPPPTPSCQAATFFFLSIAAVYAHERGIRHLVTGVSQTDFSGYPDCRDNFIRSLNVTLNEAMDMQYVIHTPLMWIDKCQTWALADRLGVLQLIREKTLTCYNGIQGDGCGALPGLQTAPRGTGTLSFSLRRRKRNLLPSFLMAGIQ